MRSLSKRLDMFENTFISVAIFTSLAISVTGVFYRYVLGSSLSWVEESAGFLLLIIIAVGIGAAVRQNKHLRVDILIHLFPRAKKSMDIIADVFALGIMSLLCYLAAVFFIDLLGRGQRTTSMYWMPIAVPVFIMPLGYLTAVIRLIEKLRAALKTETPPK